MDRLMHYVLLRGQEAATPGAGGDLMVGDVVFAIAIGLAIYVGWKSSKAGED